MLLSLKNISPVFILFIFLQNAVAQITWQQKADMPTARKEIADAATQLNGKIYVLGGKDHEGNISNVFECYDPGNDSWSSLAAYPIPVWRSSLEAVNGKIYAMGGYQSLNPFPFAPTNKAHVYDPDTDSWEAIQDIPVSLGSAATIVLDEQIHLIGGGANNALSSHFIYDPITDVWSTALSMNTSRSGLSAALVNGKIYAFGGYFLSGGVQSLSSAERYDPSTNNWTPITAMPFTKLGISSAVLDDRIYIIGNENNTNILEYDPLADSWQSLSPMPEDVNFAGAVRLEQRIFIIGGGAVNLQEDGIAAVHCFSLEPVALEEIEKPENIDFELFPNPIHDKINIRINVSYVVDNASLDLYDIQGKKIASVYQGSLIPESSIQSWNIPSHILPGLYYFKLCSREFQSSKLIFKIE